MPVEDRFQCRWSYERLLLSQPHIETAGLWTHQGRWYVVLPRLNQELKAESGEALEEWFGQHKSLASPIELCAAAPDGSELVPDRTPSQIAQGQGDPLTLGDVLDDLALRLPRDFPDFLLTVGPDGTVVRTVVQLSPAQEAVFRETYNRLGLGLPLRELRPAHPGELKKPSVSQSAAGRTGPHALDLAISKRLDKRLGRDLTKLVEEDEDLWMSARESLFTGEPVEFRDVLPRMLRESRSRCLVDASVFNPSNIRTYLPIYEHVAVIAPLGERQPEVLAALRATEEELMVMAREGRLLLLLPSSVERYRVDFLSRIAAEAPETLVLSRRLASLALWESRRRMPFLYPGVGMQERSQVLRALGSLESDDLTTRLGREVGKALSSIWSNAEMGFHRRGAMASLGWGAGGVLAAIVNTVKNGDYWLELTTAAAPVEWAAALRATLFPGALSNFSQHAASEICASLYSGVPTEIPRAGDVELLIRGLLTLDNDAPLKDVMDAFRGADIERLRRLIEAVAGADRSPEVLAQCVSDFNESVRSFERKTDRLKEVDVVGLAGVLGVAVAPPDAKVYVGLGAWLLKLVMQGRFTPGSGTLAELFDKMRAANAWTRSDVVMVSRLRRLAKG